jgi:hypothetical protein
MTEEKEKPLYERDQLLKDMREGVCEIMYTTHTGKQVLARYSLLPVLLPENYKFAADKKFHKDNPDIIVAWDVNKGGWFVINIYSIANVSGIDPTTFVQ